MPPYLYEFPKYFKVKPKWYDYLKFPTEQIFEDIAGEIIKLDPTFRSSHQDSGPGQSVRTTYIFTDVAGESAPLMARVSDFEVSFMVEDGIRNTKKNQGWGLQVFRALGGIRYHFPLWGNTTFVVREDGLEDVFTEMPIHELPVLLFKGSNGQYQCAEPDFNLASMVVEYPTSRFLSRHRTEEEYRAALISKGFVPVPQETGGEIWI
jgi:hypothetical protein